MPAIRNDIDGFDLGLPDFSQPGVGISVSQATQLPTVSRNNALPEKSPEPAAIEVSLSRRWLWTTVPSWMTSMFVHAAAILILAAWNLEPIRNELRMMLVSSESTSDSDLDDISMDQSMTAELVSTESDEAPSESPTVDSTIAQAVVDVSYSDVVAANMPAVTMPSMTQSLIPKNGVAAQASLAMRAGLNSRSKETKRDLLSKFGGSSDTEKAVSMALKWLANHQDPQSGAWTLAHSLVCKGQCDHPGERRGSLNAATGLALMCFLGAGQTHLEGEYKETVFKGLSFLISNMKFQKGEGNSWYAGSGFKGFDDMYAHGIATIAMCEAYGMTKDPALRDAAQAGLDYLRFAQNPSTGGWHYAPKGLGDTSVVGWQMMALKSGAMSGFAVDIELVRKANFFLDQMAFDDGASYHYDFNSKGKQAKYNQSCTACAVLCRMYSGVPKDHPSIKAAVEKFSKAGPSKTGTYYNYYATQVLKQYGGKEWDAWNVRMRDQLLATQVNTGHAAGSWYWDDSHSTHSGGRFYTTCMGTMILEVYYRYMPLYNEQTAEDAFKL